MVGCSPEKVNERGIFYFRTEMRIWSKLSHPHVVR